MPRDTPHRRRGGWRTEIEVGEPIQPIKGMNDVLPEEIGTWQYFEACTRELLAAYGYEEIRVPIVEHTELFKRAIGEHTDVVGKEMYTFSDRGGESLTLRPEATAGIVRALISNGLLRGQRHKLWCLGPMFRHEAPQAGRYRQFWQVDVEAVGWPGPDVDAELIALSARLWRGQGINGLKPQVNSLGTPESRRACRARVAGVRQARAAQRDADRLVARLQAAGGTVSVRPPDVYVVVSGAQAGEQALELVERLRSERPRVRFELNLGAGNLKAQFRRADKSGAPLALIIGDDELARGVVAMKPLREESGQSECPIVGLAAGVDAALARGRGGGSAAA